MENSSKQLLNSEANPFRLTGLLPATGQDGIAANTVERLLGLSDLDAAYRGLGHCRNSNEFILTACSRPLPDSGHTVSLDLDEATIRKNGWPTTRARAHI